MTKTIKLSPRRQHGFVTAYTASFGSAEARMLGVTEDGNREVLKIIDEENGQIIFKRIE